MDTSYRTPLYAIELINKQEGGPPGTTERQKRAANYAAWDSQRRLGRRFIPNVHTLRFILNPVMRRRQTESYQKFFQFIRWKVIPFVFGWSVLLSVVAIVPVAILRFDIGQKESSGIFCVQPIMVEGELPDEFETSSSCWPTGRRVKKGAHYRVLMDVTERWAEGGNIYANPIGIDPSGIGWFKSIEVVLFSRSMRARWFQPLIRISEASRSEVQVLNMSFVDGHTFAGSFTAGLDGELLLFVNETMVSWHFPWGVMLLPYPYVTTDFYKNNRGRAVVRIVDINGHL